MTSSETRSPLEAARKLVPLIRSCADQIEAERELPRPLFEALADAGMFHLAVPRALGGSELDLPTYVQVIEEIGKADASTGWIVNQGAIFATYAARMPHEVARSIWIDTPRSVVANSPAPTGKAVVVPGGYRVTARQGFSTGCRHAAWLAANAQVVENGHPRLLDDGQPEARYLFVPVADAEILDTWHVRGMRGTGTHHFAVNDVFVPAERSVLPAGAPLVETGPLYQIPRTLLFASGDASVALGVARSCLEAFFELAGAKTPRSTKGLLRDQPLVQSDVGHAEAQFRSGRAFLTETVREVWAHVSATGTISLDQRATLRLATTHAIRLGVQVVDTVYNAAGVTAVYEGHPLQRHFQDIHVISQHIQSRLANYELVGRHWLGLPVDETRL
ncbi:MAG TPA: acyl-CoA dehydrogenase family protein [Methylomirabilota bacterium]|jgi:alkylation response protein AidB-like acyl-CoA dehydrogenase|nr:acyl-CoA dehydrogenase family protein [Methylomirabilota bacterium]